MQRKEIAWLVTFFFSLFSLACEEDPDYGGFVNNAGRGTESSGSQAVTINLGATASASTVITYRVGGTAALDGDYHLTSVSKYFSSALTITVPAGESAAVINFDIIDDNQVEPVDEIIYFEITSISDATIAKTFRQTLFVYQIEDNDDPPVSGLQVDLAWNLGDGVRINASNFDLYLANEITVDADGAISDFQVVEGEASINESGFETISIDNSLPDQQYYIIIKYLSGENTAEITLQLTSGQIDRGATARVNSALVGRSLYYGPITKSGTTFSFR